MKEQIKEEKIQLKKDEEYNHKNFHRAKMEGKMRNNYQILEEIGNTEYGDIFKCQYQESMNEHKMSEWHTRAVKISTKSFMKETDVKEFENEVSMHYQLQKKGGHPSIIKMYYYY